MSDGDPRIWTNPTLHPERGRQLLPDGTPNPAWLERDPATGCLRWLGSLGSGGRGPGIPQAWDHAGRRRNLRRDAWERAYGPIPPGTRIIAGCRDPRCLEPTHLRRSGLTPEERAGLAAAKHGETLAEASARLGVSEDLVLAARGPGGKARGKPRPNAVWLARGRLPPGRPPGVTAADWAVVAALAAGTTIAEVAAELGVTRQAVHLRAKKALRRLGLDGGG